MFLQPKKDSEFSQQFVGYIPKEGEVRLIANRNTACAYYFTGIEQCRRRVLEMAGKPESENHELGFLPCKRLVDAHYRCLTDEKYGYTIEEAPEQSKVHVDSFFNCAFQEIQPLIRCRSAFDNVVRSIYRSDSNELDDSQ